MSEVLHANIFFFIASAATVVFLLLVAVAMYYIIRILMSVRKIVERIEAGSDVIAEDVASMRDFVKSGGLVAYLINRMSPKKRTSRQSRTKDDEESD